jgi:Cu-Zn family superoxide dismutase
MISRFISRRNPLFNSRDLSPFYALCLGAALAFTAIGCTTEDDSGKKAKADMAPTTALVAASGTVSFYVQAGGIRVQAQLKGLPPGLHGFHVHDKGSCDSAGVAAGGHFNPMGSMHGLPDSSIHHTGDLGNITAGFDGTATVDKVVPYLSFEGTHSIIGHALIIHALPDDGGQPTGNAGGRISCAVIAAVK